MEMEVMEVRLIRASELNGEMDDDNIHDAGKQNWLMTEAFLFYISKFFCYVVLKTTAGQICPKAVGQPQLVEMWNV